MKAKVSPVREFSNGVKRKLTARQRAIKIAAFALEKKAEAITILDMRKLVSFCDFFIIVSATVARHAKAVAEGVIEGASKAGIKLLHEEGEAQANWILLDFGDCVIHVFQKELRNFYDLEHLWQDAPKIKLTSNGSGFKKVPGTFNRKSS